MEKFMRSAAVIVCASFLTLAVAGCGKQIPKDALVGTWDWNIGGGTIVVTLDKDGTGSISGPQGVKAINWRIQRGNNFVFKNDGKDTGFLIDSAEADTIRGNDPQSPGTPIVWTRRK